MSNIDRNISRTGGRVILATLRQLVADLSEFADELSTELDYCVGANELYEALANALERVITLNQRFNRQYETIGVKYYDSGDESDEGTNELVDWTA